MNLQIRPATSDAAKADIFGLRYRVYVEELGRYRSVADHGSRRLIEDDDAYGRQIAAYDGDRLVGAMRWTWGGDAPFRLRHINQYDLAKFLDSLPPSQLVIGERFMVVPEQRGTDLLFRMFCAYMQFVNQHRIQLVFGDCEPHLLNLYQGLGFRTYTRKNFNSAEAGYLIPLVIVAEDVDYLRAIGSPLAGVLHDFGPDSRVPGLIDALLADGKVVHSERLMIADEYCHEVFEALSMVKERRVKAFDGLTEEQVERCLAKSSTIQCQAGDRIVKAGNVAKNMFIILAGMVEVRDGNESLALLSAGDVFGEIAFLLQIPRTRDVYAITDDVRVLSLSETQIRKIIQSDPAIAAQLLLNISRMLGARLAGLPVAPKH